MTYRTQDPAALQARIVELEAENAKLRRLRRRLTQRGWILIVHVLCVVGAVVSSGRSVAALAACLAWAFITLVWVGERGAVQDEGFFEPRNGR